MRKKILFVCCLIFSLVSFSLFSQEENKKIKYSRATVIASVPNDSYVLDLKNTTESEFNTAGPFSWQILNVTSVEEINKILNKVESSLSAYNADLQLTSGIQDKTVMLKAGFSKPVPLDLLLETLKKEGIPYAKKGQRITKI